MMAQEDRDEWPGWSRAHWRVIPEHHPQCCKDPPRGREVPVGDLEHGAQSCRPPSPIQLLNSLGHSSPRIWTSDVQLPGKLKVGSIQEEVGSGGRQAGQGWWECCSSEGFNFASESVYID